MAIPPAGIPTSQYPNADAAAERAKALGGEVIFGPIGRVLSTAAPCVSGTPRARSSWLGSLRTTSGRGVKYDPGSLTWHELMTTDSEAAIAFYTGLLGPGAGGYDGAYGLQDAQGRRHRGVWVSCR